MLRFKAPTVEQSNPLKPKMSGGGVGSLHNDNGINPGINNRVDLFTNKLVSAVDFATDAPNKARKLADKYTDFIIDKTDQLKNRSTQKATENLTKSKVSGIFAKAGEWLVSEKKNMYIAIGAVLAIVVLFIRK